jgi:hypothetical protein
MMATISTIAKTDPRDIPTIASVDKTDDDGVGVGLLLTQIPCLHV